MAESTIATISRTAAAAASDDWISREDLDAYINSKLRTALARMRDDLEEEIDRRVRRAVERMGPPGGTNGGSTMPYDDKVGFYVEKYLKANPPKCDACPTAPATHYCNEDTRLSRQRKTNLRRKRSHTFSMTGPIAPGASQTYSVPAYNLGRIIEYFQFRPTMDTGGDPNQLRVTIRGEDGVEWAQFSGGKHDQEACCLLEWFEDDCIGWSEGWTVTIEHIGAVGDPAMKSAVLDYAYVFPGQTPQKFMSPGWCFPKGPKALSAYRSC